MRLVILGAGGMARELAWLASEVALSSNMDFTLVGFVVTDLSKVGMLDSKEKILGDYRWLQKNLGDFDSLAVGIGNPQNRLKVLHDVLELCPSASWPTLIHPSASCSHDTARIGRGVAVCAGARISVGVTLEDFSYINPNVTIGHEAFVGYGTVVNPGANISGGVEVDKGVLIGAGAQVLQYLRIGENATVGAGAVVNRDVGINCCVVGVPARPIEKRP